MLLLLKNIRQMWPSTWANKQKNLNNKFQIPNIFLNSNHLYNVLT